MKYEDFLEKLESLKKEKSVSLLGFEELKNQMEKEIKELFESGFTLRDQNINDKNKDEIEKYYVYFTKTVKENKRKFYANCNSKLKQFFSLNYSHQCLIIASTPEKHE